MNILCSIQSWPITCRAVLQATVFNLPIFSQWPIKKFSAYYFVCQLWDLSRKKIKVCDFQRNSDLFMMVMWKVDDFVILRNKKKHLRDSQHSTVLLYKTKAAHLNISKNEMDKHLNWIWLCEKVQNITLWTIRYTINKKIRTSGDRTTK